MPNLPPTKPNLNPHTQKASHTYPSGITNARSAQGKLPLPARNSVQDLSKSINIHQTPQQSLPEDNRENDPDVRQEIKQRMSDEQEEISDLQKGGEVKIVDTEERRRGAGEEDAELVDGGVGGVEGAVAGEGRVEEGKE